MPVSLLLISLLVLQAPVRTAQQLYYEANNYIRKNVAPRVEPTQELKQKLRINQINLARRNAAELAARSNRTAMDEYYLGLLYHLGEDSPKALATMKKFLADYPHYSDTGRQTARVVIAMSALKLEQLDEAERTISD